MKPKLIMMIGLVASGKSTYAKELSEEYGYKILSSDSIRVELFDDINDQSNNKLVFNTLHQRINEYLENGESVVYDATNISHKRRRHFLNNIVKHDCQKVAIVMATPYNLCIDRNLARERSVPTSVIERMYKSFYIPHYSEGFDVINFVKGDDFVIDSVSLSNYLLFNQHNHNHSLTLGEHMRDARMSFINEYRGKYRGSLTISKALEFHDIGKPFVMKFKDYNNRMTNIAHYYNHENVSAYITMIELVYNKHGWYEEVDDLIEVCNLIQYHMIIYHWTEKSKKKWTRRLGEDFIEKLEIVNKYDKLAH